MIKNIPSHLQPQVCVQIYRQLLDACPFLYDCTASGCVGFLTSLKVQVCNVEDFLMKAGSVRRTMYILVRGEVKIDYDADAPKATVEMYVPGGRRGAAPKKTAVKASKSDALRGRTDRLGTLLGFQDVFKPIEPLKYSVKALSRVAVLSITRGQFKDLLTTYVDDKPIFQKAIDHAEATIQGGSRRSSSGVKAQPKEAPSRAVDRRVSAKLSTEEEALINDATKDVLQEDTASARPITPADGLDGNGSPLSQEMLALASNAQVGELTRKLDALTKLAVVQAKMMKVMIQNANHNDNANAGNSELNTASKEYNQELEAVLNTTAVLVG